MKIDLHIADFLLKRLTIYRNWRTLKSYHYKTWLERFNFENLFGSADSIPFSLPNGVRIMLYKDNILSKEIFKGFEEDELDFLNHFLHAGDTFLDIGANVGLFSIYAANKVGNTGHVHAFEPSSTTYGRLQENIQLNSFSQIIESFHQGLSSEKGALQLSIANTGFDAFNSFAAPTLGGLASYEEVPVTTLDEHMMQHNLAPGQIALAKIDVEGWEVEVLKGAKNTLGSSDAPVLIIEFTEMNARNAGTTCAELSYCLRDLGYTLYTYNRANSTLKLEPFGKSYDYMNLIAIKGDREVLKAFSITK